MNDSSASTSVQPGPVVPSQIAAAAPPRLRLLPKPLAQSSSKPPAIAPAARTPRIRPSATKLYLAYRRPEELSQ